MTCRVTDIRTRTFDVEITGRSTTEKPHDIYVAKLTPIMLSRSETPFDRNSFRTAQRSMEAYRRSRGLGSTRARGGFGLVSRQGNPDRSGAAVRRFTLPVRIM